MSIFDAEAFQSRHIGPSRSDAQQMLHTTSASSLEVLIDEAIPARIRLKKALSLPKGVPEQEFHATLRSTAAKNQLFKS